MNAIIVKTAKRDTTVTRTEVRRAVKDAYNKNKDNQTEKSTQEDTPKKAAKQH